MKSSSLSGKAMQMESVDLQSRAAVASVSHPGVTFLVRRMSFGRRVELMKRVRDLAARAEFFQAGCDEKNKMEASLLGAEIDRLYVEWGLEEVCGLSLDGSTTTPRTLIDDAPEELFLEALEAVRRLCGLSEPERKN